MPISLLSTDDEMFSIQLNWLFYALQVHLVFNQVCLTTNCSGMEVLHLLNGINGDVLKILRFLFACL